MSHLLKYLELKYKQRSLDDFPLQHFDNIYERYRKRRKESIADIAVVATGLSVDIVRNLENELALEAIQQTNPNFDANLMDSYSDLELQGIINSSKGKYFELLVADKLNNGEVVGNMKLPDGYSAELAESQTQPGWDLQIIDNTGSPVEYFQLKATENVAYIKQTLEQYPDIKIIATEEVAGSDEMVVGTYQFDDDLTSEIQSELEAQSDDFLDDFIEGFNPLLPLCFIVAAQGYKVVSSKSTYNQAIEDGKVRTEKALVISSVGALSYALGAGWFSLPLTIGAGVIVEEMKKFKEINYSFGKAIPQLQYFNDYRKAKLLSNGIF